MILWNCLIGLQMVSVSKLLSSCIDAGRQGSEVIRDYRAAQNNQVTSIHMKVEGDAKSAVTQADYDAQVKIVHGLRNLWGDKLKIIGEEDDAVDQLQLDLDSSQHTQTPLRTDLLDDPNNPNTAGSSDEVPMHELTVFVDPLDGTREFVEGRVENVACLIGIARNKKSLGGVIGLPFPEGKTDADVVVHYALLDNEGKELNSGAWSPALSSIGSEPEKNQKKDDHVSKVTVLTGDANDPILINATSHAMSIASLIPPPTDTATTTASVENTAPEHRIVGGTAAKLRIVATEDNSIAILHFVTMLWDSCGPEALVHAKGGKVTDLFGSPLVHSPEKKDGNVLGVVASSGEAHMGKLHDELCTEMRADEKAIRKIFGKWMGTFQGNMGGPQAVDVARNLEGEPLDKSWVEQQLAHDVRGATLKAYAVPESDTARGMMSNGCRLLLEWDTENMDATTADNLPSSAFYKRVVMADLAHARAKLTTAPKKLQRDVKSYQVETAFLTSHACQNGLRKEAGVRVTRAYGSDLRPAEGSSPLEQIESRFAMLLEDFSEKDGWTQQWLLDEQGSRAALKAFAKMHAFFWNGSNFWSQEGGRFGRELEEAVWPNGNYMQPALQGYEQLEKVAAGYKKRLPFFRDALGDIAELHGVDIDKIGERLQSVAKVVGEKTHPFFDTAKDSSELQKYRTLIHGDPKQANIFLREIQEQEGNTMEVGLIDFQWTGFGLAAADVAHYICAAVQPTCISYDGSKETELLDYYYDCLSEALVDHGVASSKKDVQDVVFPRRVLQDQYEIAVLDICRMVFAYAWDRWKAETKPSAASLNRNAYNKSLPNALWLITRCSELLSAKEHELTPNKE